jgi:hypothetical protein
MQGHKAQLLHTAAPLCTPITMMQRGNNDQQLGTLRHWHGREIRGQWPCLCQVENVVEACIPGIEVSQLVALPATTSNRRNTRQQAKQAPFETLLPKHQLHYVHLLRSNEQDAFQA